MTKILSLKDTLNDYLIQAKCKHFSHFAHIAKGFVSKENALNSVKLILPELHGRHPNVSEDNRKCINKECMRTCKPVFTISQVDAN